MGNLPVNQQNTKKNMAPTHRATEQKQGRPMAAMRQGMPKGLSEKEDDLHLTFAAVYRTLRAVF